MSDSEKRSCASFLTLLFTIIALAILPTPSIARAEPFLILHNEGIASPAYETVRPAIKHSVTVGLNDNGDLMLRHKDVSLILAYNPPNDIIEPQERLRIAQRQDSPAISGISLKVTVLF